MNWKIEIRKCHHLSGSNIWFPFVNFAASSGRFSIRLLDYLVSFQHKKRRCFLFISMDTFQSYVPNEMYRPDE